MGGDEEEEEPGGREQQQTLLTLNVWSDEPDTMIGANGWKSTSLTACAR